jgi:hypothetical protein
LKASGSAIKGPIHCIERDPSLSRRIIEMFDELAPILFENQLDATLGVSRPSRIVPDPASDLRSSFTPPIKEHPAEQAEPASSLGRIQFAHRIPNPVFTTADILPGTSFGPLSHILTEFSLAHSPPQGRCPEPRSHFLA